MTLPIDVAMAYLRAFSTGDPDTIAGFVSEGFRNDHQSALGSGCVGRDEYRRRLPHFLASFGDRVYQVTDVVIQERESETAVVVSYRFFGTHAETGVRVEVPGVMWLGIRDGEITRRVDTWDSLGFLRQIGAAD